MNLAISIKQPWAWLIVNGHKDIENRNWHTSVRGTVFIHASKAFDKDGYVWVKEAFPEIKMPEVEEFQTGGIVGSAEIWGCVNRSGSPWFFGEYGFKLKDAKVLPFREYRGQLGFFKVLETDKEEIPCKFCRHKNFRQFPEEQLVKFFICDKCNKDNIINPKL